MNLAVRLLLIVAVLGLVEARPSITHAQITPEGQRGCPNGATVGGPNLITNGDFAIDAGPGPGVAPEAGFSSDLRNRGNDIYPSDPAGGFSIQHSDVSYKDGLIIGRLFPGDANRAVPSAGAYWYSNPTENLSDGTSPFTGALWRQTVTGLSPNTTYNFFAYFDNLLVPGSGGSQPTIELQVDGIPAGPSVSVPESPDVWVPIQYAFVTGPTQTSAVLTVYDLTADIVGDDFGMAAINLKQCVSNLGVAKDVGAVSNLGSGRYRLPFTITLKNYGVDTLPITNIQVRDDLAAAFPGVASIMVEQLKATNLTVNPAFNGLAETKLLTGNDALGPQATGIIDFNVIVTLAPGSGSPVFSNIAQVSATVGNVTISDASVPGTNPDPTGSGNPPNGGTPTPVKLRNDINLPLMIRK